MRMHGWRASEEEEERKREGRRRRHMWTVPPRGSAILASVAYGGSASPSSSSSSLPSSPNSTTFFKTKAGRKISVGDCALFKPPQDLPPFIGIIRSLAAGKENKLTLSVNWLYRPAEVKLGKGFLLEAAPNEIFYSFHKDEIPAASLLHPCKVAFLPKGVELPSGIGSFVCRKVYDITNKCLWWLTDQDYINERQEEVDQLLYKTRIEMHATVPSGGRSPKPMNGPTSTSQLKPGSESAQNSATFPSQVKGKKRERGDQSSEPVKRERCSKLEDGDSGHSRTESNLKTEIANITEKGGLVDFDGVEKLVQLMLTERSDKKIDLVCRSLLAGVVAVTDKFDCLNRFVQLKGLPVFDEWLQEVHKGKIGDSSSPKDGDKLVEEFLLILLRALDKVPVNLHALQMCNIGKSVNHLRTHKNVEIQKKARSLVDTWKKRVEAEMDAKSGSNQAVSGPALPRLPEVSHSGNRQSGGSSEVAIKSLVAQPAASKTASVKLVQGDTLTKSTFSSPVSIKSSPIPASGSTNPKDGQPRNAASAAGTTDLPSTPAKDEKSSSSSQSHNNGQFCSSDHAKIGGFSGKEDARSSATVSMTVNKISAGSSRSRKSANGFPGSTPSGVQRETGSSKNISLHRNSASDRPLQPSVTCEMALDVPVVEGSNPKIIVKIPNRGRSPAQNSSGGFVEEPSVTKSRASSPVISEKQNQFDRNFKEKNDALRADISSNVNSDSLLSNVNKDAAACSDEGSGSPTVLPDEKGCKTGVNTRKVVEDSEDISLPPGYGFEDVKLHDTSFSSMNALIESCVRYSEANMSAPVGDDIGMNLLASVAAGEMFKSDLVSPVGSPPRTPVHEPLCDDNDSRVKSFTGDHCTDSTVDKHDKLVMDRNLWAKTADSNPEKPAGDRTVHISSSPMDLQQSRDPCQENVENLKEIVMAEESTDGAGRNPEEDKGGVKVDVDGTPDTKQKISGSLLTEDKVSESTQGVETEAAKGTSSHQSVEFEGVNKKTVIEGLNSSVQTEQKPPLITTHSESLKGTDGELLHTSASGEDLGPENIDEVKAEKADEVDSKSHINQSEEQKSEWKSNASMIDEDLVVPHAGSADNEVKGKGKGKVDHMENLEVKEVKEQRCTGTAPPEASTALRVQETGRTGTPKLTSSEGYKAHKSISTTIDTSCSAAGISDTEAKVEFDLNEGFDGDDGKYGESCNFTAPGCSGAAQQLISPLPLPVSSVPSNLPASITVAAAAKGPFVPPEDLLRSKGELGWKGSAATSAFRPAEPRKVLEMPMGAANISLPDATPGKHSRLPLDIDLNVPDERVLEDLASQSSCQDTVSISDLTTNCDGSHCEVIGSTSVRGSGRLGLDLNRAEELIDISNYSTSNGHKTDVPLQTGTSSAGLLNGELSVRRDFDLNDGPAVDETIAEPSVFHRHPRNVPSEPPVSGLRLSSAESGNFSSWFPRQNTYSTVTVPSVLPDRGEQPFPIFTPGAPQRMLAPPTSGSPFGSDVFRGPVLSSSPAVPFPSASFQYPLFPFGTSFPLPSGTTYVESSSGGRLCFPAVNSQLMGPAGAVPSHFPRPYVVSLSDCSSTASTEGRLRWNRQFLDLNAGPGVPDVEGRDETFPLVPRQLSVAGSQVLTEDQAKRYQQMVGDHLKRKEPEGGWDGYKRPSWP